MNILPDHVQCIYISLPNLYSYYAHCFTSNCGPHHVDAPHSLRSLTVFNCLKVPTLI